MNFLALPWFSLTSIDLSPIGLGRLPFFSLTTAAGVLLAIVMNHRFSDRGGDIRPHLARSTMLIMVIGGYLGSYWGQVLFYKPEWLLDDPLVLFKFWRGGFSSLSGFYGGSIAAYLYTRIKREPFLPYLDRAWFAFSIGWIICRTGCACIHDHPGMLTDFFLALPFPDGIRHDLGLYELIYQIIVVVPAMFWISRRSWRTGSLVACLYLLYAPARFLFDFLRVGDPRHFGLTPAQYGLTVLFLFSLIVLLQSRLKKWPMQPPLWGPGKQK